MEAVNMENLEWQEYDGYNEAIGYQALYTNTTGTYGVTIGHPERQLVAKPVEHGKITRIRVRSYTSSKPISKLCRPRKAA